MLDHTPHQGHSATAVDHRQTDETVGIPQHGGIQGYIHPFADPTRNRLLDQGTIERLHGDSVIVKPTAKATHETLGILRWTDHKRRPRSETHGLRADQTHHHPGESFAMAKVE